MWKQIDVQSCENGSEVWILLECGLKRSSEICGRCMVHCLSASVSLLNSKIWFVLVY